MIRHARGHAIGDVARVPIDERERLAAVGARVWRTDDIMLALNIDSKNIDALKALAGQLHALQDLKLLTETSKGWRWTGDD